MSWYKQPVRPYDPIIEDGKDNESSRYYRDSFDGTGQDSTTDPPSQDASMWEALTNIMPITRGGLNERWGYSKLIDGNPNATRLASFQRDSDGLRTIVSMGPTVTAYTEAGVSYNSQIFIPKVIPRMVASRSYAYFFSGNAADLLKWNGTAGSGGASEWGIDFLSTNATVSTAALSGTSASGWTNSNNVFASDGTFATTSIASGITDSAPLVVQGFGFSIPTNATILGITANVTGNASSTDTVNTKYFSVILYKNGVSYSNAQRATVVNNGAVNLPHNFGSSNDLWGKAWLPNDINNSGSAGFMVSVQGVSQPANGAVTNFAVDFVDISVTYMTATGAITVANGGGGAVDLTVGRIYYLVFGNSGTGHFSDLSPASGSTGPVTASQLNLSTITVSTDPQVDTKTILATADGGDPSALYFVAVIPNGQTTYVDNTPETDLVLNQLYLFTDEFGNDFGVAGNAPPPTGNVCVKHKGRLWMAVGQSIYFSKSIADLTLPNGFIAGKYEESWPQDTFLDISEGAETVQGMISNGQALFVGTERHIRWITGDDPTNFSEPEVVHAEVGLLNQEVWQSVFIQGTPAGCMWLTPDFRVIGSDFNTYHDIGHPIQNILATINPAQAQFSHAMFVSDREFDLYILALPTGASTSCNTHCIYNMRSQQWVIWTPLNGSTSMLFNINAAGQPQWLFSSPNIPPFGNIYQYQESAVTDQGSAITVVARTSWLHLGAPTSRKLLDELEVVGDPAMFITIEGATPTGDFTAPDIHPVVTNVPLVRSPFGQLKVYLATSGAKDRYYRITFFKLNTSFNSVREFLRSYNLKSIPFNTL